MTITVGIPTKNRYNSLIMALESILLQEYKPVEVIVIDDSDNPIDLRTIPEFNYVFGVFHDYKIEIKVYYGKKAGQHISHQAIQEMAKGDYIFRMDDDCVAEPNVLEELVKTFTQGIPMALDEEHGEEYISPVGAVAPLVLMPNPQELPVGLTNDITRVNQPNVQWYIQKDPITNMPADHLYSCFLYRKGIQKYEMGLSHVSHREETIFTYSMKRNDYPLYINGAAKVWHFRQESGGIRSNSDPAPYARDEGLFKGLLNVWNIKQQEDKVIVLDCGLGDHFAFKHIVRKLIDKYGNLIIACSFPDVFYDVPEVRPISIAEAKLKFGNIDAFDIYKFMIDHNWKSTIVEAFEKLYL